MKVDRYLSDSFMLKWTILLLFIFTSITSCKHHPNLGVKEFSPFVHIDDNSQVIPLKLKVLEQIGVNYKVYKVSIKSSNPINDRVDKLLSEDIIIKIFKPTEEKFNKLIIAFKGAAKIKYIPESDYLLRQFLPPKIQAVLGHLFILQNVKLAAPKGASQKVDSDKFLKIDRNYIYVTTNCWSTVYEILRSQIQDNFTLFFTGSTPIKRYLEDPTFSSVVKHVVIEAGEDYRSKWNPRNMNAMAYRNKDLQFGDFLMTYNDEGDLTHVAIYLDNDLFIEKSGYAGNFPFKITTLEQIAEMYLGAWFGKPSLRNNLKTFPRFNKLIFRRTTTNSLPHPRQNFSLKATSLAPICKNEKIYIKYHSSLKNKIEDFSKHIIESIPQKQRKDISLCINIQDPYEEKKSFLFNSGAYSLHRIIDIPIHFDQDQNRFIPDPQSNNRRFFTWD